eukprot:TRINITY_DN26248_c0_g1_i2.p1 TRINITY_DN26248_c0_g1~~TRINITY_DN26248_c0_g1_i2.p1  ORF type:complete len:254 (+),score=38.92 TRINITY_DN26248_c0_g1_i2:196-957(+)
MCIRDSINAEYGGRRTAMKMLMTMVWLFVMASSALEAQEADQWSYWGGAYGCGGDLNCEDCTAREAEQKCGGGAIYLETYNIKPPEAPCGPFPAPGFRGNFSCCSEVLGPLTPKGVMNCFLCPGPSTCLPNTTHLRGEQGCSLPDTKPVCGTLTIANCSQDAPHSDQYGRDCPHTCGCYGDTRCCNTDESCTPGMVSRSGTCCMTNGGWCWDGSDEQGNMGGVCCRDDEVCAHDPPVHGRAFCRTKTLPELAE